MKTESKHTLSMDLNNVKKQVYRYDGFVTMQIPQECYEWLIAEHTRLETELSILENILEDLHIRASMNECSNCEDGFIRYLLKTISRESRQSSKAPLEECRRVLKESLAAHYQTCKERDPKANNGLGLANVHEQVAIGEIEQLLAKLGAQ